jgi:OHCU decarboxylase
LAAAVGNVRLEDLNGLGGDRAITELLRCCGARRWARLMSERRPFSSLEEMRAAADTIWWTLQPEDWLEAFAAHPRIGELGLLDLRHPVLDTREGDGPSASRVGLGPHARTGGGGVPAGMDDRWASTEQSGMNAATDEVRARLARANRAYEQRFGYIFIVCATGKAAGEMLARLEGRLANTPEVELAVAAEQQRLITRVRLDKLLEDRPP